VGHCQALLEEDFHVFLPFGSSPSVPVRVFSSLVVSCVIAISVVALVVIG
jgi:hypothetical protein